MAIPFEVPCQEIDTVPELTVKGRFRNYAGLTGVVITGFFLRFYLLRDQVLLDDEWHGLLFIKDKTFSEVLTQINPFQNSSPILNIYRYVCYHTIGVSEWNLRLPLLLTGCLMIVIIPLLMRRKITDSASIIYGLLLALSPFLIFYSRFSRAYIIIAFFSMISLLLAFQWFYLNQRRYAAGFLLISILSVYIHLTALAMAFAPYLAYFAGFLSKRLKKDTRFSRALNAPLKEVMIFGCLHAIGLFLVMFRFISQRESLPLDVMHFSGGDIITIMGLVSGTAKWWGIGFVFATMIWGVRKMAKENPLLVLLLISGILVNICFIRVLNPFGIESGAVFLRYCISVIPIVLCLSAVGIDQAGYLLLRKVASPDFRLFLGTSGIAGLGVMLYLSGPLPVIYKAPNNFTNHLAYQGNYAYGDWWLRSRSNHYFPSYEISINQVPAFYRNLARDVSTNAIIEYPFDFADHSNLCYFYQRQHQKRVLVGYCSDARKIKFSLSPEMMAMRAREKVVLAHTRPEFFLKTPDIKSRTHFRNMVDINDDKDLMASGADYIVMHKVMWSIFKKGAETGNFPLYDGSVYTFREKFTKEFGPPVFEDREIVVFSLKKN